MFRTAFTLTLSVCLAQGTLAAEPCATPCSLQAGSTAVPAGTPSHQHDAYLRSQLDWRSYYLNRPDVRSPRDAQGAPARADAAGAVDH